MVAPKKAKLEQAESELRITMQILNDKRAQLKLVQDKLAKLQADFTAMVANKEKLEAQVMYRDQCQMTPRPTLPATRHIEKSQLSSQAHSHHVSN